MSGADGILPLAVEGLCYAVGGEALLHGLSFVLDQGPRSIILGTNGAAHLIGAGAQRRAVPA